jgi:hypothetical protein
VQLDASGKLYRVIRGRVPQAFQQSAVISEHYAVSFVSGEVSGEPLLYGDCQAVVTGWVSFKHSVVDARSPMAAFWRICSESGWPFADICKVKAHQDLPALRLSGASEHVLFLAYGNSCADVHAGIAAAKHLPPAGDLAALDAVMRTWRQVMDVFMHVLPLWPTAQLTHGKLMRSRQAVANIARHKHVSKHDFVWSGHSCRCLWCFREKRTSRSAVDRLPCGNLANSVRQLALSGHEQGHRLFMAHGCDTGVVVVFCGVCAAMATTRAINLLGRCCPPRSGWQKTALSCFGKRIHPKTRESLTQPWPFAPDIFPSSVGVGDSQPLATSGDEQVGAFGSGSGLVGVVLGVGSPSGEPVAGTLAAPWVLPEGLAGDDSSEGEA